MKKKIIASIVVLTLLFSMLPIYSQATDELRNPRIIGSGSWKTVTYKNENGLYETDFIRCILWNGIAKSTSDYCHKGDLVGVKGRLQTRKYKNEQEEEKYITEVIVDKVSFLASKREAE